MSTVPPMTISEDRSVRLPLRSLLVLIGFLCAGFGSWVLLRAEVAQSTARLDAQELKIETLANNLTSQRELLIGIAADLKALNRERNRAP